MDLFYRWSRHSNISYRRRTILSIM